MWCFKIEQHIIILKINSRFYRPNSKSSVLNYKTWSIIDRLYYKELDLVSAKGQYEYDKVMACQLFHTVTSVYIIEMAGKTSGLLVGVVLDQKKHTTKLLQIVRGTICDGDQLYCLAGVCIYNYEKEYRDQFL